MTLHMVFMTKPHDFQRFCIVVVMSVNAFIRTADRARLFDQ